MTWLCCHCRQQLLGWRKQWQLPRAGKVSAHPRVMLQSMRPCSTTPRSAPCKCGRLLSIYVTMKRLGTVQTFFLGTSC